MKHIVNTAWAGKMKFDTEVNGHHIILDAAEDVGGENAGPRIKIEADLTEEHPKVYSKVHIIYEFKGKDLEIEKLQKAIELSQEKYCGVSAMYKKAMDVSYEIVVN